MSTTDQDLGIVCPSMSNDHSTIMLISFAKEYYLKNPYNQVCFFNSFCEVVAPQNIPILHLSQAKFFYGNLLILDSESLELCNDFPNIKKILFWAQNIPWEKDLKNYKEWEKLFYNHKTDIIANNQKTYDIFEICYKKPKCIAERLSYEKIKQCL